VRRSPLLVCLAVTALSGACVGEPPDTPPAGEPERPADFTVRPGVEVVTVLDARPGAPLTLYDADGTALLTLLADSQGLAHFSYIPLEHLTLDTEGGLSIPINEGEVLDPGDGYTIVDESTDPPEWSGTFSVLAVDDVPDSALYDDQILWGDNIPILGDEEDPRIGYHYIEMRDGTLLSAKVRLPDATFYGDGPYPTVIEYSGYSPSNPNGYSPGQQLANALGYASVGVNMRGTGCSGGVFDVFNRAQHADGYDIIEAVARQEWVLHNEVGMVGLSYPGISQLFAASTAPPSLAAIVPLSVIADPWAMQWPGGVYNEGFTAQWLSNRDSDAEVGGSNWVTQQIDGGDTVCAENLRLSAQNIDFEPFLRGLETRPPDADDRNLNLLVEQITVPTFLGGAWQDEQTGALFGGMLDRFVQSPDARFLLYNGRHPDGYSPDAAFRWHEFLEFHLARRVPELPGIVRSFGAQAIAGPFQFETYSFPEDRFTEFGDDYDAALAAYRAEDPVEVWFELGAGGDRPGEPIATFNTTLPVWPPPDLERRTWYLDAAEGLAEAAPSADAHDLWTFDADAGDQDFFGPDGYTMTRRIWDLDWTQFPDGAVLSYLSAPLSEDTVLTGPGVATLWVNSPVDDVTVQVTLTEVRPDGTETLMQSGHLRLGHRAGERLADDRIVRDYSLGAFQPVPVGEWTEAMVEIPSFAHPLRAGSQLRMTVSTPGRNHGTWTFEAPVYDDTPTFQLGRGGDHASSLSLGILGGLDVPPDPPPCPSLRGSVCRTFVPTVNATE